MITIRNYTSEDLEFIINNYNNMTIKELSDKLNKKKGSIENAVRKLGLVKQVHSPWTDKENEFLINNYNSMSADDIAKKLNRTRNSIFAQADRLELSKQKTWTCSEVDFLKEYFDIMSHDDLAKKLNRSRQAITAKCFDLNLYKKELPWEKWELDFVEENYMEMTTEEISKTLNRTTNAVQLKARRMGLKKYPYCCDYHYFDNINTEEKAYWLGFLTADGWISKNEGNNAGVTGIELQYGDIDHLRKFNKSISGNYKITDRWKPCLLSKNKDKKNHSCVIRIFSLTMYDTLVKHGFTNNKSFDCYIPNIDNKLLRHYIRGYFDGNGCLSVTGRTFNVGFCTASYILQKNISETLCNVSIKTRNYNYVDEFGTKIYNINICKKEDKIKFLKWIYDDCNIYLDRKYKKYLKVLEQEEQSPALL